MQFAEVMAGTWRRAGRDQARPIRVALQATTDGLLRPLGTVSGTLSGSITVDGLVHDGKAVGSIEVSPLQHRRIGYTVDFTGTDGAAYRLDGWKSIDWGHARSTWTTLPVTITDAGGDIVGSGTLRFALGDLPRLARSVRLAPAAGDPAVLWARRWDGRGGRLEVWYDTFTDPATGTGFWLHHELVAPDGAAGAELRGWLAVFPPDAPPSWERFGPVTGPDVDAERGVLRIGAVTATVDVRRGRSTHSSWELRCTDTARPLLTFPAVAWRRELLPGAQIVPMPTARFTGSVTAGGRTWLLHGAPGAAARIYGHGSAERWAWLHADLGRGDVVEVVAAVPHRPGLRRLAPLPMVQLRLDGCDWPASPLVGAIGFRARLGLPRWEVRGRVGDRRLAVTVHQPPERCVAVDYHDPDGSTATCTNTERADATVVLERRVGGRWRLERRWELDASAHAEIGRRP